MNKVYYSQSDSRWANHPYPAAGAAYANKTVKSSGCGPTCAAMVVSACKETVYPDKMCDIARQNGYRLPGGTANNFFSFIAKKYGIEFKTLSSSFETLQAVKDGYQVIILCGAGLWTSGGHFILAVGADGDNIEIYDSYIWSGKFNKPYTTVKGKGVWLNINDFKKYSNAHYFFAFKVGNSKPQPAPEPKEDIKIGWVNTTKLPLNVRYNPNGAVVGSLDKGTQVTVYETKDGWCRIGANRWCSAEYITYTKPSSGGSSKPVNSTVGQKRTFKGNTTLWSKSNLTGTNYSYLPKTEVTILENVSTKVDKIKVTKTGRVAYVSTSAYTQTSGGSSSSNSVSRGTVGKYKLFKGNTTLYSNSNLTGTTYSYLPDTKVLILENVSASVDKIKAVRTGRVAYVNINAYK